MNALEKSDLFDGLSVVHLKFSGLWYGINHYRRTGKSSRIFQLYMALSMFCMFPYALFNGVSVFFISLDIKRATFIYMTAIAAVQVSSKLLFFCYNFGDQCLLLDLLKMDFLSCIPQDNMDRVREIYRTIARISNVFSILVFSGSVLTISTWLVIPGFSIEGTERKKIGSGWYPVPYYRTPWYEIVYAYEAILMVWGGLFIALFECVLLFPLIGLYGHFLVFGYFLSEYEQGENKVNGQSKSSWDFELRKLLKDYDKLLWFANKFRDTNDAIVTIIIGCDVGTMVLCTLYIIFERPDSLIAIKLMLFLSFATVEITLLCISSSIVEDISSNIGYAFYSSRWYMANKAFKTAGQMMMVRARRPVTLTAIKMYPVNMETWINIFRFIYSTIAVLSKMK